MNDSELLFQKTAEELSSLTARLEAISAIEDTFATKLSEIEGQVSALVDRQKDLAGEVDRLNAAISDLAHVLAGSEALVKRIGELQQQLAELDIQGLNRELEETSAEVGRATTKIVETQKRITEASRKNLSTKK